MVNWFVAHQATHQQMTVASYAHGTRWWVAGSHQTGSGTDLFLTQSEEQSVMPGKQKQQNNAEFSVCMQCISMQPCSKQSGVTHGESRSELRMI